MSARAPSGPGVACLAALEAALTSEALPDLRGVSADTLDEGLRALIKRRGADSAPLCQRLAREARDKELRKIARRALYRLAQTGISLSPPETPTPARPVVERQTEQPVRAWLSGIDGTGSRVVWIVFAGGLGGGLSLCSLVLNDQVGILEAAGGAITKKRFEAELRKLRESQKLPWVETLPPRACDLVAESLLLHHQAGTAPPPGFSRWRHLFEPLHRQRDAEPGGAGAGQPASGALLDRSGELLDLPELVGWFVDPAECQEEALALLQARESRLVVSDQIKAEREAAIVDGVVERAFAGAQLARWARRFAEMALIFEATGREDAAQMAHTVAAAFRDPAHRVTGLLPARVMALRGLELAAEVTLGQVSLSDVSRAPGRHARQ